jgi:deoxyadenosine/deoxycytidine kinase
VAHNPYLEDYYHDIQRWSFNLEVYFLKERFRDLLAISQAKDVVLQDRSIFEGVYVFVANNRAMGNISERDFATYMELFEHMLSIVKLPDLMIYLRCSVEHLVANIQKRGRDYEQTMQLDYLENLNTRYEDFIFNRYKGRVLVIEKDQTDFEHNAKEFGSIVDRIDAQLFGIFGPPPTPTLHLYPGVCSGVPPSASLLPVPTQLWGRWLPQARCW